MSAHGAKIALMVSDVYIDSNIFIYAIDGSGELKTKAKARLGWEAAISMEEMIREMVDADLHRHRHSKD